MPRSALPHLIVAGLALAAILWPLVAAAADAAAPPPTEADPLGGLLTTLGPTGGATALVALVWRAWRAEADRHAEERRELRAAVAALAAQISDLDRRLGRQEDRVSHATELLRSAVAH